MADYKIISAQVIQRTQDGAFIPVAQGNADYRAYQVWLAAGNTPDPEDPPPPPDTRHAEARQAMQDVIDEPGIPPKVKAMAAALLAIT